MARMAQLHNAGCQVSVCSAVAHSSLNVARELDDIPCIKYPASEGRIPREPNNRRPLLRYVVFLKVLIWYIMREPGVALAGLAFAYRTGHIPSDCGTEDICDIIWLFFEMRMPNGIGSPSRLHQEYLTSAVKCKTV